MAEPRSSEEGNACLASGEGDRQWLAAYTRSQHEAMVARQLTAKEVAFLLPTYLRASNWSDRVKRLAVPVFPGYVFVHVSDDERVRVLQTAGVVNIVSVAGRPSPLSAAEVAMLTECAARPKALEPHPYLTVGQRVRVRQGPFAGWEGILAQKKNSSRLIVSLEQIMRSVSIDLAGADVEPVGSC